MSQTFLKTKSSKQSLALDLNSFFNLMKPRVMSLVLFTCMVGLLIAPHQFDFKSSIISLLGTEADLGIKGFSFGIANPPMLSFLINVL